MNECTEGTNNCDLNAQCNDIVGLFNCTCNTGYEGDGFRCASKEN